MGESVKMPVDKEEVSEHKRAFHEFTSIAQTIPENSYVCYTDGSEQCDGDKKGYAGSGFVIYEGCKVVKKCQKSLGVCDNNFAELSGVLECLKWIKKYRYGSRRKRDSGEVHIFLDSDYVSKLLVCAVRGHKYHRSVQTVCRLAATMSALSFILHWIPSHLTHGCTIQGTPLPTN